MIYALQNGIRVKANKNIKDATCDICNEVLIPKCGRIKIDHWAHKRNNDCDTWAEHETAWHSDWKNRFNKEYQEITIRKEIRSNIDDSYKTLAIHRADVRLPSGIVIEIQNSPISIDMVEEREKFYDNMIWIFNKDTFAKHIEIEEYDTNSEFWQTSKVLGFVKKPMFIDLNNDFLLEVKQIDIKHGTGYMITKTSFINKYRNNKQ
jgi:competence CoiA-like predicted nuclease